MSGKEKEEVYKAEEAEITMEMLDIRKYKVIVKIDGKELFNGIVKELSWNYTF